MAKEMAQSCMSDFSMARQLLKLRDLDALPSSPRFTRRCDNGPYTDTPFVTSQISGKLSITLLQGNADGIRPFLRHVKQLDDVSLILPFKDYHMSSTKNTRTLLSSLQLASWRVESRRSHANRFTLAEGAML